MTGQAAGLSVVARAVHTMADRQQSARPTRNHGYLSCYNSFCFFWVYLLFSRNAVSLCIRTSG
jgi:hypothetical protein